MAAVDHLIAALVELEHESIEIEHRQSFIRSAIEAFGIDADDALLTAMREEGEQELTPLTLSQSRAISAGLEALRGAIGERVHAVLDAERGDVGTWPGKIILAPTPEVNPPETAQQDDPEQYGRLPGGRWNWDLIAAEICFADDVGERRARYLADTFDVSAATAQWMVKRCRELLLIDVERAPVNHQAARDAAAAAL